MVLLFFSGFAFIVSEEIVKGISLVTLQPAVTGDSGKAGRSPGARTPGRSHPITPGLPPTFTDRGHAPRSGRRRRWWVPVLILSSTSAALARSCLSMASAICQGPGSGDVRHSVEAVQRVADGAPRWMSEVNLQISARSPGVPAGGADRQGARGARAHGRGRDQPAIARRLAVTSRPSASTSPAASPSWPASIRRRPTGRSWAVRRLPQRSMIDLTGPVHELCVGTGRSMGDPGQAARAVGCGSAGRVGPSGLVAVTVRREQDDFTTPSCTAIR